MVKEQIICFPTSLKEQKKIVSQLDILSAETKNLENIYQQKLNALEELKKSIGGLEVARFCASCGESVDDHQVFPFGELATLGREFHRDFAAS